MIGKVRMETDEGVIADVPAYIDPDDMLADFRAGTIREGDRVLYRQSLADVIGEMTDEDGKPFIMLLAVATLTAPSGPEFVQPPDGSWSFGPGGMWTVQFGR